MDGSTACHRHTDCDKKNCKMKPVMEMTLCRNSNFRFLRHGPECVCNLPSRCFHQERAFHRVSWGPGFVCICEHQQWMQSSHTRSMYKMILISSKLCGKMPFFSALILFWSSNNFQEHFCSKVICNLSQTNNHIVWVGTFEFELHSWPLFYIV